MKRATDIKARYFMDDVREGERLARKVNAPAFVDKYLKRYLDSLCDAHLLEAGCGPGVFLQVIGKKYPGYNVIGIDISEDRIEQANGRLSGLDNAKAITADIYQLPFPDNFFDFIFSRFVYEYLKHPFAATKELYRVCKPGGKLLLQDLDSQFTFYPTVSSRMDNVLQLLKQHTGFDPDIGRKLYFIGRSAGFSFLTADIEPYHKVFGKIDELNNERWRLKLDIAFSNIDPLLSEYEKSLKAEILQSLQDENTMMYSNLFTLTFEKL